MKAINYPYFSGALEALVKSLPYNQEYNKMSFEDKTKYITNAINRCESKAIDYNKPINEVNDLLL